MAEVKIDLKRLQELDEQATAKPWSVKHNHAQGTPNDDEMSGLGLEVVGPPLTSGSDEGFAKAADANLMAAYRNQTPALLAWVKRVVPFLGEYLFYLDLDCIHCGRGSAWRGRACGECKVFETYLVIQGLLCEVEEAAK